jgi:hypothetical protein
MKSISIYISIFFLILICVSSTGCIKLVQKNLDQPAAPQDSENPSVSSTQISVSSPRPITTSTIISETKVNPVDVVDPIYPDDYYRTVRNLSEKNGEMAQAPLRSSFNSRTPVYHLKYSPQFNATAIKVNVTRGPLVINFKAIPKINDPRISFAVITVRELPSKAVVAEEQIDNFPKPDDLTLKENSKNEKQIEIFKEGLYHINVYGNQIDVDVKVFTGESPITKPGTISGTTFTQPSEEYDLG